MAAGLGYKEFTTGDVLTAADANGYLASQVVMVFANAAARTSAIASPQEGMISFLKDTNATQYYSGSAWVSIDSGSTSPLTTKGDLYTYSTADARLGVGTNGQVLTADSTAATGIKWATPTAASGPSFMAYRTGTQSFSLNTWTKVAMNTETWDTNSNYDPTTNFRFTPTVSGYYQVNLIVVMAGGTGHSALYKNGTAWAAPGQFSAGGGYFAAPLSTTVYMNGTTDYIEAYCWNTTSTNVEPAQSVTFYTATWLRS